MHRTLLIILLSSVCLAQSNSKPKAPPKPAEEKPSKCVAELDEKCPTPEWMASYEHMKKLAAPYTPQPPAPMPQDIKDLVDGISGRLFREIPPGYDFNPQKEKFVKKAMPAQAPPQGANPATPQVPTPPPAAPKPPEEPNK
jgi:hypothetical protein